jgi:hypothetical protein
MIFGYYNMDNERLGGVEYKDGKLEGQDNYGKKVVEELFEGVEPGDEQLAIDHYVKVSQEPRASYVTILVEED